MAAARSKRRSRKRRRSAAGGGAPAARRAPSVAKPAAARPVRRDASALDTLATTLTGRTYGEPPPNPFGGIPVSELAIFAGGVGVIVWLAAGSPQALAVGLIVCALGVTEVTGREHFSGYRSHTALLAGIPAVGIGVAMIALFGGSLHRGPLLLVVVAVFGILFWLLRRRFQRARQSRLVRPPAP